MNRPPSSAFGIPLSVFALLLLLARPARSADPAEPYPLSLALSTLERDLTSRDYQDVLRTMIPTDLAAEWQRVATPDNYQLFAEQHGGADKVAADPALRSAYQRREQIARSFLEQMRAAYREKKIAPPFDDAQALSKVLASAARRGGDAAPANVPIRSLMPAPGAERQWPCFRGPTSQGVVLDTDIPFTWSDRQNVVWRSKLPGRGNSSPVVWGNRLWITAESAPRRTDAPLLPADSAPQRLLLCYELDSGKLLWQHAAPQPPRHEVLFWKNTLASSTPVTDGQRVIAFFGNAGLLCCDLDGKRLWHADLGSFPTLHGPGSTPVLYQNLVIVIQEQSPGTPLCAAFDKRTGREVWRRQRDSAMGWSSPVLLRIGDRDELVFNGSNEVISYNPASGDELWRAAGTTIESIPMIVSGGGMLFSFSGRNGPIFAIRPGGEGDVTSSHVVWRLERGGPHVPTPAWHAGRLYVVSDTGVVTCLDAASGETLSQKRLRGRFSASPLVVGDKLLLISEDGLTYVLRSGPKPEVIGQNDLGETTYATPAVLGGRLYFRTAEHLICIGQAPSS